MPMNLAYVLTIGKFPSTCSVEGVTEAVQELLLDDSGDNNQNKHKKSSDQSDAVAQDKSVKTEEMAAASKELTQEQKEKAAASASSIGAMVYSLVKKVAIVGGIYLVGYMGWSVAWLIG